MQFSEIYEKTVYAFEHDEVFELLTGQKGYAYQAPRYVADVPTCDEFIFQNGIYPYYKTLVTEKKQEFLNKLTSAFDKMIISDNEVFAWWALSLLQGQKDQESYFKQAPFEVADQFWLKLSAALKNKQSTLITNRSYLGGIHSDGLWGEVRRIALLLDKDYRINILGD
ncbi:MAG: hypothetical protein IKB86_05255 [Clostridia bacterium]|nr:hypothetical protein [Clostridia bacterium]